MKIGEGDSHHFPIAFAFAEVGIKNQVLLLSIICPMPRAYSGPHRVQIGHDEPSAGSKNPKNFPVVRHEVWQVALVQI